ncbi:GD20984 [Drosophila simulans]|uniref:GD20984 n=1 Tax=Drosophila simulans TaxID=7240 RepID=B4R0R9_DROSI|nr:GD20984 [Drosophila simulans]
MLLLLLAFIMRFVDISKRCAACSRAGIDCTHHGGQSNPQTSDANGNHTACWQHVAGGTSNSSSTSSGCDSNSSSKENYYVPQQLQHQRQRAAKHSKPGNIGVSPQQLEQIRFYQRMQQQQLQLLQQQLLQRRRLQQQLLQQGVPSPPANATTTTAGLTCNQQYLRQQRMQQQQQQQYVDHNSNNDNDYLNNYLNNSINQRNNGRVLGQGTKIRRGMTEFSTNNDHSKPHFTASQQKPHQNSPIHQQAFTPSNPNSHPHLLQRLAQQQQQQQQHQRPHKFQQTLAFSQLNNGNNTAAHILPGSSPHSPLSYRNPLNSPSNSPFSNTAQTTIGKRFQQQQLTDRLLQQQHLQQCQQQQLQSLGSSDVEEDLAAEELSEESLKQNVAIVLSNLDRYNNALRSIILNEQVSSSLITPSDSLLFGEDSSGLLYCDNDNSRKHQGNNNFVLGKMAATPESDYNSNATTPGGRSSEQQLQQQQQQQQQLGVADPSDIAARNKQNCINLHSNLEDIVKRNKALEVSMSRSAQAFQPICPMSPKGQAATSSAAKLQRYPSGNNNTETITITRHLPQCTVRKSSSLPNLQNEESMAGSCHKEQGPEESGPQAVPLNVSQAISTSTMEAGKSRSRNMLPMCQMPISISVSISERLQQQADQQLPSEQITPTSQQPQQQHHHSHHHRHKHRCSCSQESQNFHISGSASSGNSSNPPAFNLVKLFIKQKSSNSSGGQEDLGAQASAHTCMDVSSGCWPSSDAASSSSGSLEQRLRKKSMNDSGKGSAVSRHDEEEHYPDTETPRRQLRARSEAVFYDDVASSSSTGSLTATNSPAHRRRSMPLRNPQLYQLAAQVSTGSQMSSEASSEQLTQVPRRAEAGCGTSTRPLSCASSSEMITRSMQTSCGSLSTTRSSVSDRYRCVPPSFLEKLNNLGEERQAPIYVIYPNYALPDLGFVKTNASTDVIFSPFNYKMTMDGATGSTSSSGSLRKQRNSSQSVSEDEILKTLDYKHVADWQSLATLLPSEYRRRLQHIPEVKHLVRQLDAELSQRPLFCMSPPLRRNRTHICDCAKYFQGQQTQMDEASSSGSSQQPSSGYRGSSTLLTDSELDVDPLKQMYVYQYDQQRMDSGVETSPGSQLTQTPPQPMPRSILRKAHSAQSRSKRNSMIEAQQTQKLTKLEKRRSLQEPPNNYGLGSTDELADVFEEEEHSQQAPPVKQRLSRKDLDARARAESFLASLPRSELKYYAEIASILESSGEHVTYDAAALKKEVSRVLSQQKKVSFNDEGVAAGLQQHAKRFATPPNSPNISMGALKRDTVDVLEQRKIESNRFKRLQIQWELMSKDSSMLKELANEAATKSGGSTPTSGNSTGSNSAPRSRIPRPVSYPAGRSSTPTSSRTAPVLATPSPARPATPKTVTKSHNKPGLFTSPRPSRLTSAQEAAGGNKVSTRSPSRIVQPKRYSLAGATTPTSTTPTSARARTPTNRVAVTAPNTPKRQAVAQSPRPTSRVR